MSVLLVLIQVLVPLGAVGADPIPTPSPAAFAARVPAPSPVPAGEVVAGSLGHDLDHFLSGLSKKGFSGAVLVASGGRVLLKQGYGLANREEEVANDSETLFDIGPLARILTAAAILM